MQLEDFDVPLDPALRMPHASELASILLYMCHLAMKSIGNPTDIHKQLQILLGPVAAP